MKSGIYALRWRAQNLVYVGLSQNIASRFLEHKSLLRRGEHTNYKVQMTYDKFGEPELEILELCEIDKLNEREIYWTEKLDSIRNGLNIIEAGRVGFGVNSNSSKYSKMQVLKVFSLLYRNKLSYSAIAKRVGVNKSLLQDIRIESTHVWLKKEYPEQYKLMLLRNSKHKVLSDVRGCTEIVSPEGEIYKITNLTEFIKITLGLTNRYTVD